MCTLEQRGRVFVLTLTGTTDQHRLNPSLLSSIRSSLAAVRSAAAADATKKSVGFALVTAAEGKYFSNGFDTEWAKSVSPAAHHFMSDGFRGVIADLTSLPMPTVAAVTGHAAAAGCALALAHDSIAMRGDRGFFYMSEVDIGIKFRGEVAEILRTKISDAKVRRDLVLKGEKWTAKEAARRGIVDAVVDGGIEATVEKAVEMAEELAKRGWKGEVVAEIRKAAWPELWRRVKEDGGDEEEVTRSRM